MFISFLGLLLLSIRVLHSAASVEAIIPEASTEEAVGSSSTQVAFDEDVVYQTVYACQDDILKISCLDHYTIKIVRANFGRFSIAICNEGGRTDYSVNCLTMDSLAILQKR